MALNRCCNTRKLNRSVGHPQLWWTRLFLADAALDVERTMLAASLDRRGRVRPDY